MARCGLLLAWRPATAKPSSSEKNEKNRNEVLIGKKEKVKTKRDKVN